MTTTKRLRACICVATASVAVLAACGGGSGGSDASASDIDCVDPAEPGADPVAGTVAEDAYDGVSLTFASWGGEFQAAQMAGFDCFEQTSGATMVDDASEYAKVEAGVEAGNPPFDIVDVDSNWGIQNCGTLFEPIDTSIVDVSQVPEGLVSECTIPAMEYGFILVYNTEVYGDNPPTTWADFFDTENFPGKRAIQGYADQAPGVFEAALLADGVTMDQMYPLDYDRSLAKWDTIKDDLIFWSSVPDSQTMMESGEASMGLIFTGRAAAAAENGAPLAVVWDQSFKIMDVLAVPKGVENKDAAMAALNYYLGEQSQTILAEGAPGNAPINVNSTPQIDGASADFLTNSPEAASIIIPDYQWWSENATEATARFGDWLTS